MLTYRHPQIYKFFEAFCFLLVKSELIGEEGRIVLLILYDAQQYQIFNRLSSNAYEFDKRKMHFHLRKSVVTFAKKNSANLPVEVETCKMQTRRMANEAADIKLQTLGTCFSATQGHCTRGNEKVVI